MAKKQKKKKKYRFTVSGNELDHFSTSIAELEKDIGKFYFLNDYFEKADDVKSIKSFYVGRTGAGKTAILRFISEKYTSDLNTAVIVINPEDFAFKVLEENTTVNAFSESGINFSFFYKSLWLLIISTQLIKSKFGNKKESSFLQLFKSRIEKKAYKLLENYNGLDSSVDYQKEISTILNNMGHDLEAEVQLGVLKLKYHGVLPAQEKGKVQKVVDQYELLKLKDFLEDYSRSLGKYEKVYILIDDLDKNWAPKGIRSDFTGSLIETLSYFSKLDHIKVLVSLRTNLFEQIKFHQTEKYDPFIQEMYWKKEHLLEILNKRLIAVLKVDVDQFWKEAIVNTINTDNKKKMEVFDYIYKRSNNRPRDLILFFGDILKVSQDAGRVTQDHIFQAEKKYSEGRLKSLIEEWHSPYEGLDILLNYFNSVNYKIKYDYFSTLMNSLMDRFIEISGTQSLTETKFSWLEEGNFIDLVDYSVVPLFQLFYKIGFLGVKTSSSSAVIYSWMEAGMGMPKIVETSVFYVNPCYFSALNIRFDKKR